MKRIPLANRMLMVARAIAAPFAAHTTILDNSFPALVADNNGILWVRQVSPTGGASGVVAGGKPTTVGATSNPAVGVVASASVAADASGLGASNVIVVLSWSAGDTAASGKQTVVLRDGASGAGAILWQKEIGPLPANGYAHGTEQWPLGAGLVGTATTAMTVEFLAAPSGTGFQSVALTAYRAT